MTESPGRHLTEEQLLGYLDHELPRRDFGTAREHLTTCWKCQTELNELRDAIAEFVRYQQKASQVETEAMIEPWPDLRRRMRDHVAQAEAERRAPGAGFRWIPFPRWSVVKWATAGVGLISISLAAIAVFRSVSPAPVTPPIPSRTEAVLDRTVERAPVSTVLPSHATAALPPLHVASAAGLRAEVGALVTLHELQADLGEPVRVETRGSGKVVVTGSGLSRERETEIATALSNRPEIAVRFEQPVSSGSTGAPAAARTQSVRVSNTALNAALEPVLGGPSEVEAFANSVVDESDEMMTRAFALHNLSMRFPASDRASLNPEERTAVARIEADHRAQLSQHARTLHRLLETIRPAAMGVETSAQPSGLFDSAKRLDHAVSRTFGGSKDSTPLPQLFSELLSASRQLDSAILASQ